MSEIKRYVGIWYTLHKQHIHRREKCSNFIVRTWSGNGSPELLTCAVESVQDFLIKFDIKPLTHLLEISTFSLKKFMDRLTKIMNRADKNWAHF